MRPPVTAAIAALALAGCARLAEAPPPPSPEPAPRSSAVVYESSGGTPAGPPKAHASDLVGRWGFASYHRAEDRDRTLAAAETTCDHPYLIGEGRRGGVTMHLADQAEPVELTLKGSTDGHDYLGPEGPAGGDKDRRIASFDGNVLTMDFVNDEIAGRYGTQVYIRCSWVEDRKAALAASLPPAPAPKPGAVPAQPAAKPVAQQIKSSSVPKPSAKPSAKGTAPKPAAPGRKTDGKHPT